MDAMLIIAGIWMAILPKMKWTSMGKKLSLLYFTIGIYVCIIGVLSKIDNIMLSNIFLKIAFVGVAILEIITIIKKLKKDKTIVDLLAIITGFIALIFAVSIFIIDTREIWSPILMMTGSLIVLSISYVNIYKTKQDNDIHILEKYK